MGVLILGVVFTLAIGLIMDGIKPGTVSGINTAIYRLIDRAAAKHKTAAVPGEDKALHPVVFPVTTPNKSTAVSETPAAPVVLEHRPADHKHIKRKVKKTSGEAAK
jgi:hypothetical protein